MKRNGELFGIYVHWPFCLAKCPYCDFNSHVREGGVDETRWRAALLAELDGLAQRAPGRTVTSVFFGGGTPSLMSPQTVAALLDRIGEHWGAASDIEITLEANPGAAEAERFRDFRAAGVNRVSIGVQSLRDDALRFLGRLHDAAEGRAAVERANSVYPRVSFDLIYARPDQSPAEWERELDEALELAGEHLSVYQLTIEPGTAFHTLHRTGELALPGDDAQAAMFEATQERLARAGLPAYEISNHARKGAEARHNLTYWRYMDYGGIGPGAHGRLTLGGQKRATRRFRLPERWLAAVEAGGDGTEEDSPLGPDERAAEMLMMGLRTAEGVSSDRFAEETGRALEDYLAGAPVAALAEEGYVTLDETGLRASAAGRLRLDSLLAALLPDG